MDVKDESELWDIEFDWPGPRRVWLEVLEPFWGIRGKKIELSTAMYETACGVPFEAGKTYLVDAARNATNGKWVTGLCSRTREIVAAQDDIDFLRAWQLGQPLSRRVYGWLTANGYSGTQSLAVNQTLLLRGDVSHYETRSDERGYFRFTDVAPGRYRVESKVAGYQVEWIELGHRTDQHSPIDLYSNRCAEVLVSFDERAP